LCGISLPSFCGGEVGSCRDTIKLPSNRKLCMGHQASQQPVDQYSLGSASHQTNAGSPTLRVSIVIPTKDRTDFLCDTLRSLKDQNCPPAELIIVDQSTSSTGMEAVKKL